MANRTIKDAISIKGFNPQFLVEKIIRTRIYESRFWKEECFALTAELLVDKAMELKSIGGIYGGNIKPSPFLCLVLKMLQIQPEKEIIIEFIRNEDFKYVRALGAIYMRLTGTASEIYKYLEPLYIDYRKMKRMNKVAKYELLHVDEFIDELLHAERVCDIALPRLQKRQVLEEGNELEPRISPLEIKLDDDDDDDDEDKEDEEKSDKASSDEDDDDSRRRRRRKEAKRRSRSTERDGKDRHKQKPPSKNRPKYVDYDNPHSDDEIARFKRSPSPTEDRRRSKKERDRRSSPKSRSHRSKSRERERKHHKRSRSRSRSRSRERHSHSHKSKDKDKDRSRDEQSRRKSSTSHRN